MAGAKQAAEKVSVASRKRPSAAKAGRGSIRYVRAKARTLREQAFFVPQGLKPSSD
jgi:hypothetical protein